MIEVHFSGRTGNNLFQYFFGRILADQLRYSLTYVNENHASDFNLPIIEAKTITNPFLDIYEDQYTNQPIENILKLCKNRKCNIHGYWQKASYYTPYRHKMKKWVPVDKSNKLNEVDLENDVIIHIRRDDYILAKSNISLSYYDYCLSQRDWRRLYIIGSGFDDKVIQHFNKYSQIIEYVNISPFEDFKFMMGFKYVVMSNSSFCWMATFLSDVAERVWYPKPVSGYWSHEQNQDLYIPGFHSMVENVKIGD